MKILKELKLYTKQQLYNEYHIDECDLILLEQKRIIKYTERNEIQFIFVGMLLINNIPMFVIPKYVVNDDEGQQLIIIKSIIRLMNSFSEREKLDSDEIEYLSLEKESLEENIIPIMCYLLDDYLDNGIYMNEIEATEINGDGDINWERTIEEIDPVVINKQWLYSDFITYRNVLNENNYITKLHGTIINDCLKFFDDKQLNMIFDYSYISNVDNSFEEFDDYNNVCNEIDKEITIQFNDRKRRILQAMKLYIEKKCGTGEASLSLYGTRNFKWIWEVVCGYVFENEFIKQGKNSKYSIYKIESPKWLIDNRYDFQCGYNNDIENKKNRLTPDILNVYKLKEKNVLLILDAKYYFVRVDSNGNIIGNPGIDDITKQYLYHTALKKYISENNIGKVINAFLFPGEKETYVQGKVSLGFMEQFSDTNINLIKLNVVQIINLYCNMKRYNISSFIDMIDNWNNESNKMIYKDIVRNEDQKLEVVIK